MKRCFFYGVLVFFAATIFFSAQGQGQGQGQTQQVAATPLTKVENGITYRLANKPLFRDPVFDGAADPVLVFNKKEQKWFMYYTNRRANMAGAGGVAWVHSTRIGIAESADGGATWRYRDTCNINFRSTTEYTHWAPEVIEVNGTYHMYLTYVPGIFTDWEHPREIVHLTSKDGVNWDYQVTLKLFTNKVIDACVLRMPNGSWRMWYNNERDGKSIYYADSPDLYAWTDKGKANMSVVGEGPKAFVWKGKYWMVVDAWKGLVVFSSPDALNWTPQEQLLVAEPGTGADDNAIGQHPDVVVSGEKVFLIYFTHPRALPGTPRVAGTGRRSSLQAVELKYQDGKIVCNRNEPTYINLISN